jgi:hypothetical protein
MDVISITVKSEAVNTFREFNTDKQAEKYLRTINRLHMAHRMQIAGPKPKKLRGKGTDCQDNRLLMFWQSVLSSCIHLKIEIISTKQL